MELRDDVDHVEYYIQQEDAEGKKIDGKQVKGAGSDGKRKR